MGTGERDWRVPGRGSGYLLTWLGSVAGLFAGGVVGAWFGGLDEANDPFGAFRILGAAAGGWAGAALGIWLALRAGGDRLGAPTAQMFVVVSIPTAIIVGLLAAWSSASVPDAAGYALVAGGFLAAGSLARWIVVGKATDDPFVDPQGGDS